MNPAKNPLQLSVIFLHIPKTAGSSLYSILESQYPAARSFKLNARNIPASIRNFKKLPEEKRAKIRLLYGHMNFGLHTYIPGESIYFTLLRDPVERVMSHYYYVLRRPRHYLYEKVAKGKMSLKEYVSGAVSNELNNGQARLIGGIGPGFHYAQCPPALLEQAKRNLQDYFVLTGLTEFFDETMLLLKEKLNWKVPVYFKEKVTLKRPTVKDLDEETLKTIKRYNQLDLALYEYVKRQFTDELESLGNPFQAKLNAFRYLNTCWRRQFLKISPNLRIKLRANFAHGIKKRIIKECELRIKKKNYETAAWLITYALELFPRAKKLKEMSAKIPQPGCGTGFRG